jgi:GNAT superfamily N-acetyltransferase
VLQIVPLERDMFAAFLELATFMQQECEPDVPLEPEELLMNMFRCIGDEERQTLNSWICIRNKRMIGMAVASAAPFYFSKKMTAILNYWYVLPEYRGTRAAMELLRAFEKWARGIGATRIYVGAERINDVAFADRVNEMIEKRGFTRFGHQFYKGIR